MKSLVNPLTYEQICEIRQRLAFQCPLTAIKTDMRASEPDPHDPAAEPVVARPSKHDYVLANHTE